MKKNPFAACSKSQDGQTHGSGSSEPGGSEEVLLRSPGEYSRNRVNLEREIALLALNETTEKYLDRLNALTDRTGMPVTQENGQRRYGPPLDTVTVPPRGSEVFVGKMPRDCFEADIVPIFETVGRIYELRLMMDFSGTNRGYCFVHFFSPVDADRAVRELNNFEIRPGRFIGVVKSVDNCRLFIGGIPKNKTEYAIRKEVDKITEGVVKVIVYPSLEKFEFNRGFAFVEYENHKTAAMARRKLVPGKLRMWGHEIAVDWAEPEPEVEVLYVRNIGADITEKWICDYFNLISENGVKSVRKVRDYAFVNFFSHSQAVMAKTSMENEMDDTSSSFKVHWAKSPDKNKNFQKKGNKIRFEFNLKPDSVESSRFRTHQIRFGQKDQSNIWGHWGQSQPFNANQWNNKSEFQTKNESNGCSLFGNENETNANGWNVNRTWMNNSPYQLFAGSGYQNSINTYAGSNNANYIATAAAGLYGGFGYEKENGNNSGMWTPINQNDQRYNGGNNPCSRYY